MFNYHLVSFSLRCSLPFTYSVDPTKGVCYKWHWRHPLSADFPLLSYLPEPNNIESLVVDEDKGSIITANQSDSITRLRRAAATAISAAAVKAKFLGDQEEYQIRRLTALMIEKLVIRKCNNGIVL